MNMSLEFETIYKTYFSRIHDYMIPMVGPYLAEDVAQDVFNKVRSSLAGFRGESSLSTWIYRIATNTAIDKTRTLAFKISQQNCSSHEMLHQESACNDDKLIKAEMNACVREFVDRLPENFKTVLILSEYQHISNKDIAEILGLTVDTVKIRLHRARKKLKEEFVKGCTFYHDDENVLMCDRK